MTCCSPISTCARSAIHFKRRISTHLCGVVSREPSEFCCYSLYRELPKSNCVGLGVSISGPLSTSSFFSFQTCSGNFYPSCFSNQRRNSRSIAVNQLVCDQGPFSEWLEVSFACLNTKMRFLVAKQEKVPEVRCRIRNLSRSSRCAYAGLICSLLVCYSSLEPAYAEAPKEKGGSKDEHGCSNVKSYDGKKVYTDFSIIGIPGDGRCLFRSVAHGACIRSGRPAPSERFQRELADDLRARVADEFVKRREETEWFVEGDFDTYVSQIRKPHVWGGEPELFMASHVLQMPISVYMHDEKAGGLFCIAEYGQEYGKDNPIRVIYHGFGHYDALQIHDWKAMPRVSLNSGQAVVNRECSLDALCVDF